MQAKPNKLTLTIFLATCVAYALVSSSCGEGGANVTAVGTPTTVSLSAGNLSFGTQPVAMTSRPETVTVTNTSKAALKISSLKVTGANARSFVETNTCSGSIAAGRKCTIAILFTPGANGNHKATLAITDNAPNSPQIVTLTGNGMHDVILTWTPSPTPGIIGYIIFRSIAGRADAKALNSNPIAGTIYADTDVQASIQYQYWIRAIGFAQSPDSAAASATVPNP